MEARKCRSREQSLEWYYKNKQRISENKKNKPKKYCKYCDRDVYEYRYNEHVNTELHKKNCDRYTNRETVNKYPELKTTYDELVKKHDALKEKYVMLKEKHHILKEKYDVLMEKHKQLKIEYNQSLNKCDNVEDKYTKPKKIRNECKNN